MPNYELLSKEQLSEFDLIVCIDTSGSMSFKESDGRSRWAQGEEFVRGFAEFADDVDDDGLTVITFGGQFDEKRDVIDGVTAQKVHDIFTARHPNGSTPLAEALDAAARKHFSSPKKTIVLVATDGAPNDPGAVERVIIRASKNLDADGELTFLFVQIGTDPGAAKFLDNLDDDLQAKGAKFDIVDAINQKAAESMTPEQMLSKAIVD